MHQRQLLAYSFFLSSLSFFLHSHSLFFKLPPVKKEIHIMITKLTFENMCLIQCDKITASDDRSNGTLDRLYTIVGIDVNQKLIVYGASLSA